MGELSDFTVGQAVELQNGRTAIVRFVGSAHFAPGDWIGVELDDTSGKNDGSVQGQRYFNCEAGHGMFVRPGVAAIVDQPTPRPVNNKNGNLHSPKPNSRHSVAAAGALKRQSINNASPTPTARSATPGQLLRAPSKSPTKQTSSRPSAGHMNPRTSLPPSTTAGMPARPSIGVVTTATSRSVRQSLTGSLDSTAKPSLSTRRPAHRLSTLHQGQVRSSSRSEDGHTSRGSGPGSSGDDQSRKPPFPAVAEIQDSQGRPALSPALSRTSIKSHATASSTNNALPLFPPGKKDDSHISGITPLSSTSPIREMEDLKTKFRLMEKKRVEDREKLKALDRIQSERDKFEGIILKLQAKYQPQQQEIAELKRQVKEAEAKAETNERQQDDIDTAMEMATLDREMAEETAESLKHELEALRQKHEELELEVEILREENSELSKEMSPEERTSQGWMQMERSNDRLREALMRLRDVAQERETELKQQIKELETDAREHATLQIKHQAEREKLRQSNAITEDLRQQLEIALGAEEMIEDLTDRNMSLSEQLTELKAVIEDLESLKEVNDELEMNHVETEKQMLDDIDFKEMVIKEYVRKSGLQDETIGDLEYSISRFRDLVTNLQSDLEDMRASQQMTETEANDLSNRSKAMLDLNMRLQTSATKAQVKTIDLELRRLDAREAAEHLAIVRLFLPDGFIKEQESINMLLRFRRIESKSFLVHSFVKERLSSQRSTGREDDMLICCDVLDKLIWVSTICERFVQFMHVCSLEVFDRLGSALYDLDPVERGFNSWIDGLKKDELKEQQCAAELSRYISLLTHLAEVHISDGLQQCSEHIRMLAGLMQSNLENSAVALSITKSMVQSWESEPSVKNEGEIEVFQHFLRDIDAMITQVRSTKVVSSKAIHQLQELQSRSLCLDPSTLTRIQQIQARTAELVSTCRQSGLSLFIALHDENQAALVTSDDMVKAICSTNSAPLSTLSSMVHDVTIQIQNFYQLAANLSHCRELPVPPPSPWELLSKNLRAASETSAANEKAAERLKDELSDKNTALAIKDKILEEMSVNVEVLEKRVSESSGRRERLREMEGIVQSALMKEKETAKKLFRLEQELQALHTEREAWRDNSQRMEAQARPGDVRLPTHGAHQDDIIAVKAHENVVHLEAEIEVLRSTIRQFRLSEYEKSIKSSHSFLAMPLTSKKTNSKQTHLAYEAQDMLKSMLTLISHPKNQVVEMIAVDRAQRLGWRPVRQTMRWQVGRQREEWEGWREWRDSVAKKGQEMTRKGSQKTTVDNGEYVLARLGLRLPDHEGKEVAKTGDVRIVDPGVWEEVETLLGVT
ncbi:hypothetical protein MMC13_000669 [Lambiella insularis]|nr:hypothetical protein [Lambiella insularis]